MAKIRCQAHWDPKQGRILKTYQILSTGPKDEIEIVTSDAAPIVLNITAAQAKQLVGLEKTQDASDNVLYKIPKVLKKFLTVAKPAHPPAFLELECGTIAKNGEFKSWGGFGPDGK